MSFNPKRLVADGYNRIAEEYSTWAHHVRTDERTRYSSLLFDRIVRGGAILELGCGAGLPTTYQLAQRFAVTGVDLSTQQVSLARRNVPSATFIHADMAHVEFPPMSFDAVVAFYSLVHLPRHEQPALLCRIAQWLRCGGLFVATLWPDAQEELLAGDWFNTPMFWSGYDAETSKQLIQAAGMQLISAEEETADEFGEPITFLWIVACRPDTGDSTTNA